MVIGMEGVIESLLAPVPDGPAEGLFDAEDELYLSIDLEMVKLGGLHAATLDWSLVEANSVRYLQQRCKHFRVVGHLMNAWFRQQQWQGWVHSIHLLAGMVRIHWLSAYPRPGQDGLLARQKQYAALGQRALQALKQLQAGSHSSEATAQAERAVDALALAEQQQGIAPSLAEVLRPALARAVELAERAPFQPPRPARTASPQPDRDALGTDFFSGAHEPPLGSEREIRAASLKLADLINQQDGFDPTGYLLRRRALWSGIHGTPPARGDGRTEMMNVPVDISIEYQEAVAGGACSPALLMKIERSVASSPYWLRGSYIAAVLAQRLEMPMVAVVIRSAVARFVQRLPTLRDLLFSDGSRFIDDETLNWASTGDGASSAEGLGNAVALTSLRAELMDQQKEGKSVEAILLGLQSRQPGQQTLRERSYASAAAADLLHARGLTWLAQDLYAGIEQVMSSHGASEWESDLFRHVATRGGRSQAGQ